MPVGLVLEVDRTRHPMREGGMEGELPRRNRSHNTDPPRFLHSLELSLALVYISDP